MNIVITGSLGNIGKPLTTQLVGEGHQVTVISSNPAKQQPIEALGARAAIGFLAYTGFLVESFSGAEAVFCMIPPDFSQPDQIRYYKNLGDNYGEAIRKTGVKRVIHLSSYGAHLPSGTGFITGSYQVEQVLNGIPDLRLTHIRPTFFYYNLLAFIDMIKTAGFIGAVYGGKDKLAMVSPQDIAVAVAEELVKTEAIKAVRYVNSDNRTCEEVAAVIGRAINKPDLQWLVLPKEEVLKTLKSHDMPEEVANKLVELGEAIHSGLLREDYEQHTPPLGQVKLEAYAREFAEIFKQKS